MQVLCRTRFAVPTVWRGRQRAAVSQLHAQCVALRVRSVAGSGTGDLKADRRFVLRNVEAAGAEHAGQLTIDLNESWLELPVVGGW